MPAIYDPTGHSAGEESSSTYEGRHLTLEESYLTHPDHTVNGDNFVQKGDPIVSGRIVGVSFATGTATGDLIAFDTEGIWYLNVVTVTDGAVASAIAVGDEIFINRNDGILSKITNIATQQPFGYALYTAAGDGLANLISVKVHHDPTVDAQKALFNTVPTTEYGKSMRATLADPGHSEGLCDYQEGHVDGVTDGLIYNHGSWINVDVGATLTAGYIITPYEGGIYCDEAQGDARIVFAGQHMAILVNKPASLHAWRLNTTETVDALIAAANAGSVGYIADAATGDNKVGAVPMFDIVGHGIRWVRLYPGGS